MRNPVVFRSSTRDRRMALWLGRPEGYAKPVAHLPMYWDIGTSNETPSAGPIRPFLTPHAWITATEAGRRICR